MGFTHILVWDKGYEGFMGCTNSPASEVENLKIAWDFEVMGMG